MRLLKSMWKKKAAEETIMSKEPNVFWTMVRDGYRRLFITEWSIMVGAVLIGILSVICFAWARPWGVVGGLRVWGDWVFYGLGLYSQEPRPVLIDSNSVITLGLMWGAFAASLMAKQFAIRVPPRLELYKGAVGGVLIGIGAALAGGCNVGGFYSAISALSLSGFVMMAGLLLGARVGLKYLYWEMEHLAPRFAKPPKPAKPSTRDWTPVKPYLGWLLLFCGYAAFEFYRYQGYVIEGGILLCGMGFGFILVRSRFCFARAFREPFMSGEAAVTQAVIVSLAISILGFMILKWGGLRGETAYVSPNFGLGGLVGGFIFGVGMLITGGCGSGTAWRAAEGQVKLMVALVCFTLSNSLTKAFINASPMVKEWVGYRVYIPEYLGYRWTLAGMLLILGAWYLVVSWNEKTDRFVVDM